MTDGKEGRRSTEVILAIYKSAETGQAVKLPLTIPVSCHPKLFRVS